MSSYQNAEWLRRLWSLAAPGAPTSDVASNVSIVNSRESTSSRERAPFARHSLIQLAPGAGLHNFVCIEASDTMGTPVKLLHDLVVVVGATAAGLAFAQVAMANRSSVTHAGITEQTPLFRDSDPDVTPRIFAGTIATANVPAATGLVQYDSIEDGGATPAIVGVRGELRSFRGLPFAGSWNDPRSLYVFSLNSNVTLQVDVSWQAFRS